MAINGSVWSSGEMAFDGCRANESGQAHALLQWFPGLLHVATVLEVAQ